MTILVTGGAGYIGSHCVLQLQSNSAQSIIAYDNLSTGHQRLIGNVPLVKGDIRDQALLEKTMREHSVTAVMHFAASCYVGDSVVDPASYYDNNVRGSLSLLQAMRNVGVDDIVFSSSCSTYGKGNCEPLHENVLQEPINPYGFSKLVVERMLADFSAAYSLNYVSLRYFNAAGADPNLRSGELHDPETHLIPLALKAAQGKRDRLFIYGTDYDTADKTCVRDYVHVTDIAEAHRLALLFLQQEKRSDSFNIGSESGFSVRQVIEACGRITGRTVPVEEVGRRPGDPHFLVASAQKIRDRLGWIPKHSSVDEIIETAWKWEQLQSN